mgnify:FL=1|jgi:hypothetical protein
MSQSVQEILALKARVDFLEEKIMDSLETMKQTQERMCSDISKIKEAVYNPDNGLYARLRVVEDENRQKNKIIWLIFSSFIMAAGAVVVAHLS